MIALGIASAVIMVVFWGLFARWLTGLGRRADAEREFIPSIVPKVFDGPPPPASPPAPGTYWYDVGQVYGGEWRETAETARARVVRERAIARATAPARVVRERADGEAIQVTLSRHRPPAADDKADETSSGKDGGRR